jgi:hypothetical protein
MKRTRLRELTKWSMCSIDLNVICVIGRFIIKWFHLILTKNKKGVIMEPKYRKHRINTGRKKLWSDIIPYSR